MATPEGSRKAPAAHAVVIPLFGQIPRDLPGYLIRLAEAGLDPLIVDNRMKPDPPLWPADRAIGSIVLNRNRGGIAGALNRGVTAAIERGAEWITILDKDSRVDPDGIGRLLEPLMTSTTQRAVVGPTIWDAQRNQAHDRPKPGEATLVPTRLLISSGTTFHASQWPGLGPFHEGLFIDYVDHYWSFRAQQRGYTLLRHCQVVLLQEFGHPHPNPLCRWFGMQLYSPERQFYSLRNLFWLAQVSFISSGLMVSELFMMLVKPFNRLLFIAQCVKSAKTMVRASTSAVPLESR